MKKVICVVGSQGGIGAALCERLQAHCDIIRMDVDGPIPIDLADPASIERAFASARAIAPQIDALAVTAGILHLDKLANLSLTEWNRVMAINLTGPFA